LVEAIDGRSAPALSNLMPRVVERMLGRRHPDAAPVAAVIERLVVRDVEPARQCLSVLTRKTNELSAAGLSDLKPRLQPTWQKILSGKPTDPLYLSAQLLAARWQLGQQQADAVRRLFVSREQPEGVRLSALEALITFQDPELLPSLARVLASDST